MTPKASFFRSNFWGHFIYAYLLFIVWLIEWEPFFQTFPPTPLNFSTNAAFF